MTEAALPFRWTGEVMEPLTRFMRLADERFVIGEVYHLDVREARSEASHNFYFARLHDLWMSLPDDAATQFPTPEILRKHALCMSGFRREKKFVAPTKEEARKLAAWEKDEPDADSSYSIISVNENVVVKWTPLSQSRKGMPAKGQFEASKRAVLDWVEDLLGVKDSGEARDGKGHVIDPIPAPITQPLGPGTAVLHGAPLALGADLVSMQAKSDQRTADLPLGARLKRLAEALHVDTPEELQRVRDEMRASEEALALYREAPKQTKAIVQLSEQFAGQLFTETEYQEVLGKIVEDTSK